MRLAYQGFDQQGKAVAATLEAEGLSQAREALHRQGFYVTRLHQDAGAAAPPGAVTPARRRRAGRRLRQLAMFCRHLHALVSTGTPVVQALAAIERQTESAAWRQVVADLRTRVEEGVPLSQAMAEQPQAFDAISRSLVAAGESSGKLGPMLDRLAAMTRRQLHLRSAMVGAMVYPVLLMLVGAGVLVAMMLFVLPRFEGMFEMLDVPLPPTTELLLTSSRLLLGWWWLALLLAAAAMGGLMYWLRTPAGIEALHTLILRLPRVGKLARSLCTARFARILGVLVESQVPLLEALRLTQQSLGNVHYQRLLESVQDAVARGEPMSGAMAQADLISPSVCEAVHNGEQSGQVGPLLVSMADFLDEENETVVKALTSILEPVILVLLGLVVGFIAVSMFLPLFDLAGMAQGGPR